MADPTALLRKAMKRANWTQAELARQLKIDKGVVCRVLSGERRPSVRVMFELERLLKVPVGSWREPRRPVDRAS